MISRFIKSSILNAVAHGYPARIILNQIARRYPQHANKIEIAQAAGYTADQILKRLDRNNEDKSDNSDQYLTEHERVQKRDKQQKRKAAMTAAGVLGTAGAVAVGAYGYATRNQGNILPGQGRIGGRGRGGGPNNPGGLPQKPNQKALGYSPRSQQQPPMQPNRPVNPNQPSGGTPNTPIQRDPEKNINLIRNLKEDTRIQTAIKSSGDLQTATEIVRKLLPRSKVDLLDKVEGGLEQVVSDYAQHLKDNPPAVREQFKSPQAQSQQSQSQLQLTPLQEEQQQTIQQLEQEQSQTRQTHEIPAEQRTQQIAQETQLAHPQEEKQLDQKRFAVPGYKYPGESSEDFTERKILYNLVNKGAKALIDGKSFLDFPVNKEAIKARGGYSTAKDVLLYMAGIPNIYDPLLDDEEKEELMSSLIESEQMTIPGLAPTKGERPIHGAQLAPSLVWNLLLSIEPKLATMKRPPAMKGIKAGKGQEMGTTELKRALTHMVYGVLSGRTISAELSDKIAKISKASSNLDIIVQAAKDGNMRRMDDEMSKLMDDAYFTEIMSQEIEDMLLSPEQKEQISDREKEDKKGAAALKSRSTREKKKKQNED